MTTTANPQQAGAWERVRAALIRPGDLTPTGTVEMVDHHGGIHRVELLIDGKPYSRHFDELIDRRRGTPATPAAPSTGPDTGCAHRLAGGPLVCTNPRPHEPGRGCIYQSTTGSDVDDRHSDGGHG